MYKTLAIKLLQHIVKLLIIVHEICEHSHVHQPFQMYNIALLYMCSVLHVKYVKGAILVASITNIHIINGIQFFFFLQKTIDRYTVPCCSIIK